MAPRKSKSPKAEKAPKVKKISKAKAAAKEDDKSWLQKPTIQRIVKHHTANEGRLSAEGAKAIQQHGERLLAKLGKELARLLEASKKQTVSHKFVLHAGESLGIAFKPIETATKDITVHKTYESNLSVKDIDHHSFMARATFLRGVRAHLPNGVRVGDLGLNSLRALVESCLSDLIGKAVMFTKNAARSTVSSKDVACAAEVICHRGF